MDIEDFKTEEEDLIVRGRLSFAPYYESLFTLSYIYVLIAFFSISYWRGYSFAATSYDIAFKQWKVYTLLTSLFVHADIGHILGNSVMLVIFGYYLKGYYGSRVFPVACLFLGIITNIFTLHFMHPETRLIGASGMVYAMVGLWLVYYIRFDDRFKIMIRVMRALGFAVAAMFPSVYQENVSYLAHAFGFLFGVIFGLISCAFVEPRVREEEHTESEISP